MNLEKWEQRYGALEYFYGTDPNDLLRQRCDSIRLCGTVLCLAEGEGRNAVFLAGQGYQVTAVDQSVAGLAKAERLAAQRGVSIVTALADLADYPMGSACWDGIVSIWCHLPRGLRADVHRRAIEALTPGGVFLLETYTPAQLAHHTGGPRSADLLPTLEQLQGELVGLELVHAVECERMVHEGSGHDGLSAVVQIVAIKGE